MLETDPAELLDSGHEPSLDIALKNHAVSPFQNPISYLFALPLYTVNIGVYITLKIPYIICY
jgi:hypothetical protein